jgi:hypothetical protein
METNLPGWPLLTNLDLNAVEGSIALGSQDSFQGKLAQFRDVEAERGVVPVRYQK